MSRPSCQRCARAATHALAVEGLVLRLCRHHARALAARLVDEPVVEVGGRRLHVDPPAVTEPRGRGRR